MNLNFFYAIKSGDLGADPAMNDKGFCFMFEKHFFLQKKGLSGLPKSPIESKSAATYVSLIYIRKLAKRAGLIYNFLAEIILAKFFGWIKVVLKIIFLLTVIAGIVAIFYVSWFWRALITPMVILLLADVFVGIFKKK